MEKNSPLSEINENIPGINYLNSVNNAKRYRTMDVEKTYVGIKADTDTDNLCILENVDANMNHPIVKFKYDLKSVLTYSNHDVKKWFNLDYVPHCLLNLDKCSKLHGRHIHCSVYEDVHMSMSVRELLREKDFSTAFNSLWFCVINEHKIPQEATMNDIFQVVLDIRISECVPKYGCYVKDITIEAIEELFSTLTFFHPPHACYMKKYYKRVLSMPISNCKHTDHHHFDSFSGIFIYCIYRLERELSNPHSDKAGVIEKKHSKKIEDRCNYGYDSLDRKEKIYRLFVLIRIFIDLLEQDMVFRTIIYNKYEHFARKFIISAILWRDTDPTDYGSMKLSIRKIINIFIMTIRTKCSRQHCDISARLLAVVVHAVHLNTKNVGKTFFNLTPGIRSLATEISVAIQSETSETVIQALQLLRPCFMKYLVSNNILNVIIMMLTKAPIRSPTTNYNDILVKRLWRKLPSKSSISENDVGRLLNSSEEAALFNGSLSADNFIAIFQGALLAFVDTFDLKAINYNNIIDIISFFEQAHWKNNNKYIPYNESITEQTKAELVQFREIFERHFDYKVPSSSVYDVKTEGLDYCDMFEKVMKSKQKSQKIDFVQQHLCLPIITWVTGRNYYKKCILYLNIKKLIDKIKVEEKQLFEKFTL